MLRLVLILILLVPMNAAENLLPRAKKFFQLTPAEVDVLLPQLHHQFPDFQTRLYVLAQLRLNIPYDFKAIGDGSGFEPKPIFRIDKTNCTAFVLTNMALASAMSYSQAESLMTYLNYYPQGNGKYPVSYDNRIHFTSDRLLTSPYFELITTQLAPAEQMDTVRLVLNRQSDGTHFLPINWEKEIVLPYIPRQFITSELLSRFPAVCGIGVIQKELFAKGIAIAHEGVLFNQKDFFHASRDVGRLKQEDFLHYSKKRKKGSLTPVCDGIVVYRMKEVRIN